MKIFVKIETSKALETKLSLIGSQMDRATATEVGKSIVENIKDMTAAGASPIAGNGKFPAYKHPDKYPGSRKSKSPVNLRLSGDFMDSLRSQTVSLGNDAYGVQITYGAGESVKERGHRDGANSQPKRPTLPQGKESFAQKIKDAYTKIIQDRISKLAKS